ncbi:hypothetical protein Poli38472_010661 [Pythium oligandrum]|uniref:Uncharacterized protein n=1 Tax=Pythium oligandrum TaxID=41045 RepID=A0A8K1C3F7_PYTOL|nr:hypothetical protein Poli38472_010661 [Pythium oligandrum]|eukprot:TMW55779.1 hypothetical protein Poli38472_010661 [Pythium oligandrum]
MLARGLRQSAVTKSAAFGARRSAQPRVFCSASKPKSVKDASKLSLGVGIAAGGFAGTVSALTGVGGGLILIPVLAKFTTLTQQAVNGTSIGAVTVAASVGAYNHFESGACNFPLALLTTLPSVIFARYGVQTAHRLSSKRLSLVVGSAMLMCSPLIALKNSQYFPKWSDSVNPLDLQCFSRDVADQEVPYIERIKADVPGFVMANAKYVGAGCFAGFISGLCGLGGGILMTAYLTAASDLPQEVIIGTSLLSIVPTAASSTYFNVKAKSIHIPTAARVGGSLAVGVYLTSKYVTHQVPEDTLRKILATTLGAAAIVMMRRGL